MLPVLHTFHIFTEPIDEDSACKSATSMHLKLAFPFAVHVNMLQVLVTINLMETGVTYKIDTSKIDL